MQTASFAASRRLRSLAIAFAALLCAGLGAIAQEQNPAQPPGTAPAAGAEEQAYALISTSKGDIAVELYRKYAPISVENFLKYVDAGYYNQTVFHRVMPTFMIQGGGYTADIKPKPGTMPAIKNEWQNGLSNRRGTLAMARLGGQADSATSQFFINVVDNAFLDEPRDGAGYAVFGQVIAGMNVVDAIRIVPTGSKNGMGDVPNETVEIKSVKRLTHDEALALAKAEKAAAGKQPSQETAPPTQPVK